MTIKELITAHSLDGSAAEIADALNAKTIPTVSTDTVKVATLINKLSPKESEDALKALKAASSTSESLDSLYTQFMAQGITHEELQALRKAGVPVEFEERIAAILEPVVSLCEQAGLPAATEAAVQAAINVIANDVKRKRLKGILDGIVVTFDLNPDTTMVDIVLQLSRGVLTEEQVTDIEKALKVK